MRSFIFLSNEGETLSPSRDDLENMQVLDVQQSYSKNDACIAFRKNISGVARSGFKEVIVFELKNQKPFYLSLDNGWFGLE